MQNLLVIVAKDLNTAEYLKVEFLFIMSAQLHHLGSPGSAHRLRGCIRGRARREVEPFPNQINFAFHLTGGMVVAPKSVNEER